MYSDLLLLNGRDYKLINGLNIKHPKLLEIIELEEKHISNPKKNKYNYSDYVDVLVQSYLDVADVLCFDFGIWYEDIKSEWDFFIQKSIMNQRKVMINFIVEYQNTLVPLKKEAIVTSKLVRDALNYFLGLDGEYVILELNHDNTTELVLQNAKYKDNVHLDENGLELSDENIELVLNENVDVKITEAIYNEIVVFLNKINFNHRKYMFLDGGNKYAKKYILKQQYKEKKRKLEKGIVDKNIVTLDSIVSSLIARGQPYQQIQNYPIYLVYDLYFRLLKIDNWNETISAVHNGCVDTEKNPIDWEKINWSNVINLD